MKTSCRQINDLFEVMQQLSTPSGEWYWRILLENSLFSPPCTCLTPHSGWMPCDISITYTSLKSAFNGLQFHRWQYGYIFIRLAVIGSDTREMSRNSKRIWPYSSSRSSKVVDLGVNGKPTCDFLLVINCNFSRIYYRFLRYSGLKTENCWFYPPFSCLTPPLRGEPLRMSEKNWHQKTRIMGLTDSEKIMTLAFFVLI